MRRRWVARRCLAAAVAALLVGCSLVGIAYNNADEWLLHQADTYLDLRSGQREALRVALRQRLADHRTGELAGYVEFLDRVRRAADDGLDAAEVDQLIGRLEELGRTSVAGTLPAIADVLATLEPAQVDHLAATLEDDDRRFRKGSLQPTAERRAARRARTAVRALEHWTGDLTALQRERVEAMSAAWPDLATEWDAYRRARSAGLVQLLHSRPDAATVQRYLASQWLDHDGRSAALASGATAVRRAIAELIVAIDGSLTTAQRAAFLKRVRGYRGDLAALLPSPSPAVADLGVQEPAGAVH